MKYADNLPPSHSTHSSKGLFLKKVGVIGFEPTTLWSQTRCASQTALHPDTKLKNRSNGTTLPSVPTTFTLPARCLLGHFGPFSLALPSIPRNSSDHFPFELVRNSFPSVFS